MYIKQGGRFDLVLAGNRKTKEGHGHSKNNMKFKKSKKIQKNSTFA